jgi:trimeric autotransporter adhesin
MKAKRFFVLLYLMVEYCYSQVGINTVLPDAQLDIRSSNQATPSSTDGLLIPKIDAFPAINPTAAQQGMMVYLTTATTFSGNPKSIGFYYWDNVSSDWIAIGNNQTSGWAITGNSGINAATHFIGTNNNADVVFKRGNIKSGLLGVSQTSFGLFALSSLSGGQSNSAFGANALRFATSAHNNSAFGFGSMELCVTGFHNAAFGFESLNRNGTGNHNSAFGSYAMTNNNSGDSNSAFGSNALVLSTTGNNNSAFGDSALSENTSGSSNSAFGVAALATNSGSNNSAFGTFALVQNFSGQFNSGFGFATDVASNGLTNATAIGAYAEVATSNSLVLGSINGINGATASVNVGIGTTSPQTRLDIMDENVVTNFGVDGNLLVRTNNPQAADIGGSITLGGMIDDAALLQRNFASVEGRKTNSVLNSNSGYLMFKTNNAGSLAERMRITATGDVGIGTATPGGQFELSLNEGRKPGSTTWTVVSDSRLKTVDGTYTKGLNEIVQLQPIRYHYKNNGDRKFEQEVLDTEFSGFIAQEVQPLFPDAVQVDEDGFLSFNMHSILVASINAIKELNAKTVALQNNQSEVEQLKKQVELQQQINADLQARLKTIEEKLNK